MTATQMAQSATPTLRVATTPPQGSKAILTNARRLDRLSTAVVRRAADAGITIEALGHEPLFDGPRLYAEGVAPWILSPASRDPMVLAGLPVPAREQAALRRIVDADMDFPAVYIAHQLSKVEGSRPDPSAFDRYRPLSDAEAARLLGRPPAPAATRRTAGRLDRASATVGRAAVTVAKGAAVGAAATLAVAATALDGLDPAIVGALTLADAGYAHGTPATWFLLTHWDW